LEDFVKQLTLGALILSGLSYGGAVTGLCNTGETICDGPFLGNGAIDAHYTIISGPVAGATYVESNPAWTAADPNSQWIGPAGGADQVPGGFYTYETTFNASTTNFVITGLWSVDNIGYDFILNGKSLLSQQISGGGLIPYGYPAFQNMTPFTITSGFVTGLNILDFVVQNGNFANDTTAPSGLRVSMTAATTSTPEPGTLGLTSLFLAVGFTAALRKSRRASR
jgi:hypothetical protein